MSEALLFDDSVTLDSPTGAALNLRRQLPAGRPRGVVLVQHGLAEHSARYRRFALDLAAEGFAVYAHDHRGHGSTTAPDAPLRRFAKRNGASKVLSDTRAVHRRAIEEHPGVPVIVFGHSMGGLIALDYAETHGRELAGAAIWNANLTVGVQQKAGRLALKAEKALKGSDVPSLILTRATFEAWGKSIEPRRTMSDWLSHDAAVVDAYRADPLCGWAPTISMFEDIMTLIFRGASEAGLSLLPGALPLHLLGGTADPATDHANAVRALAANLRHHGARDVTLAIVEGARHETLQEVETYRAPALAGLLAWLDRLAPRR